MKLVFACLALFAGAIYWMLFGPSEVHDTELAHFALDEMPMSVERDPKATAAFDPEISSDGGGSVRIDADGPTFVTLAEVEGKNENLSYRQLVYEAKVKTEDVDGPVFLVMQAGIALVAMPVVGIDDAITGTNDWTPIQIFAGNPEDTFHRSTTSLQLEVRGTGTVWVDDLRLVSRRYL